MALLLVSLAADIGWAAYRRVPLTCSTHKAVASLVTTLKKKNMGMAVPLAIIINE